MQRRLGRARGGAAWTMVLLLGLPPALPAMSGPSGPEVARQVDYVNRFGAVRNVSYGVGRRPVTVIDRAASGRMLTNSFQRWRRNDYPDGPVAARDLVIFRRGKLRGTAILVTDFAQPGQGRAYAMWLPALRKIRRFAEPDPADGWGNSNFTFGDIYIRRPEDESHRLEGRETFGDCLGTLRLPEGRRNAVGAGVPGPDCSVRGRAVYRLRSQPRRRDLGYDERLTWVDVETYADYRSVYYRDGAVHKVIDKSWHSMGLDDPRAQFWRYWYAQTPATGQQGMAFAAREAISWNDELDPDLWSERRLRQTRR